MSWRYLERIDHAIIGTMKQWSIPFARLSIFVVYFWFGLLKVFHVSPASPLVTALQERTIPFIASDTFLVLFGVFEVAIGCAFLLPRAERIAIGLMVIHMITTALPLILVRDAVWSGFLIPTLEGQYIIKNIALLAVAASIAAQVVPMQKRSR